MYGMTSARKTEFTIRVIDESDYPQVREILQRGMDTGEATFEHTAPDWEEFMEPRIPNLVFIAVENVPGDAGDTEERILGWISASRISHRDVFKGVIEDSIYMAPEAVGKGVAGALLDHLLLQATEKGYWAVHSSIFPENEGSLKLHESRGFRRVGVFHCMSRMEYGPKAGRWRNIVSMEKVLEHGPAWNTYQEIMQQQ